MDGSYLTTLFRYLRNLIPFLQSFSLCYSSWKIFLKVVACAVFLSLGFAFYVFFAPFVGNKTYQYIVIGLYSPLVTHLPISLPFLIYNILIFCFLSWFVKRVRSVTFLFSRILVSGFFCKSEFYSSFLVAFYYMIFLSVKIVVYSSVKGSMEQSLYMISLFPLYIFHIHFKNTRSYDK